MLDGIKMALEACFRHLHIEGDNQLIIQVVQGSLRISLGIHMLVQDIISVLPCFSTITTQRVHREGNLAADWMAKLGCLIRLIATFFISPSPEFSSIIRNDYQGRTLEKRDA